MPHNRALCTRNSRAKRRQPRDLVLTPSMLRMACAQTRAPSQGREQGQGAAVEQQLAWSCAARVLQYCGRGAGLRRLATVPGFGREVGWRQALGALSLCARALRDVPPGDATAATDPSCSSAGVGGKATDCAHETEDEKWKLRFMLCAACLPLALSLVERAEQQQRAIEDAEGVDVAEAPGSDHESDSTESVDFDTIDAPSDAEEAAQVAAEREREWRINTASLEAATALAAYVEEELTYGWQLQKPLTPSSSRGGSGRSYRVGIWWAIGQFMVRLLTASKHMAARTAVRVLASSTSSESDNEDTTSHKGEEPFQLQNEWRSLQRRIVRSLFVTADAGAETVGGDGDVLLPPPPPLGYCFMASASCGMNLSSTYGTVGEGQASENIDGSNMGSTAFLRQLLDLVPSSKGGAGAIRPWVKAAVSMEERRQPQRQQDRCAYENESTEEARVRWAGLVVACHCHAPTTLAAFVPVPLLATPQRRLLGMFPLLSATFYSNDREDLTVGLWQTVAEALLNHLLILPSIPLPRHSGTLTQPSVPLPRLPVLPLGLRLRPFDLDRGAGMVDLLHSLLLRCTGSEAQSRLTPENATKQLHVFETVLTKCCAVEDQLWLLPALLMQPITVKKDGDTAGESMLTLSSVLVVQRLVLRACTATVREIKQLNGQDVKRADAPSPTKGRIQLLSSRVLGLYSLVAHCLAASAHGGLGGQQQRLQAHYTASDKSGNDGGCEFDCAAFVRGADMIVGALSILRMVTAYKQWATNAHAEFDLAAHERQQKEHADADQQRQQGQATLAGAEVGKAGPPRLATPPQAPQKSTTSAPPSPGQAFVAVSVQLDALRLRVETYGAALARLEQHAEAEGGDSDGGSLMGLESFESVSQSVTTLQMLLQAIDAAAQQLQLHQGGK